MKIFDTLLRKILGEVKYAKRIGVKVGNDCIFYKTIFWGSEPYLITIGNNVRITDGVRFINHDGGVHILRNLKNNKTIDKFGTITIGNNVHIGIGTIIMPNVTIGDNCIIGCGAVVTKNIPDNSIAVGVPARVIETVDEYYSKNKDKFDYTKQFSHKEKKDYLIKKYKIED